MRSGHVGRAQYPVQVAPDYAAHHERAASVRMAGWAEVRAADVFAFDESTRRSTATPGRLITSGRASLVQLGQPSTDDVGGQRTTTRRYAVSLHGSTRAALDAGQVVRFVEHPDTGDVDPQLAGRPFTVIAVDQSTVGFERSLIVSDHVG